MVFLVARVLVSGVGALAISGGEPQPPAWASQGHPVLEAQPYAVRSQDQLSQLLVNGWYRWDTGWHLKNAVFGYRAGDGSVSFQPLYPLLIRLVQPLAGGNYLLAALLVSNLCGLGCLALFYRLVYQETLSKEQARRAVLLLVAFPAAFFLWAGYTESLYLLLVLAAMLLAQKQRWGWALVAGGLAALTRMQGVILVAALGWLFLAGKFAAGAAVPLEEVRQVLSALTSRLGWRRLLSGRDKLAWVAVLMPLLAFLAFNLGLHLTGLGTVTSGYATRFAVVAPPWEVVAGLVERLGQGGIIFTDWVNLGLFCVSVILSAVGLVKIRPAYSLFNWAMLLVVLMTSFSVNLLAGFMRYMLATFPLFLVLVKLELPRAVYLALFALFLAVQLVLVWLFINWIWVA